MFEQVSPSPRFQARFPILRVFQRFGGRGAKTLFLGTLLIVPILFLRGCTFTYVNPGEIGLRQIAMGPSKGLQKEIVGPGYRRQIRGYETIRTFPRNTQVVEFTSSESEANKEHRTLAAVNVPTVDGYPVTIDATVLYRIIDPYLVVSKNGFNRGYEDNVVIRFTDPAIKKYLGELKAEEFYRDARRHKVELLKRELAQRFKENGLLLSDVLIRQYYYPETFQTLTEQKKIQDQSVLTNRALAKQAEVNTRLNQVVAEGQNLVNVRAAEFQAKITGINAQRDLYERQKHAEADLLVRSAEASGTQMINQAMEGAGSDKLLKLRKGLALLNAVKGPIYVTDDLTDIGKLSSTKN
jgi:regulator of protease activity HflC (stomatin/prohibitin superfamily)